VGLIHLGQWADARCFERIPSLKKLAHAVGDDTLSGIDRRLHAQLR
jgi:hypothetical protein